MVSGDTVEKNLSGSRSPREVDNSAGSKVEKAPVSFNIAEELDAAGIDVGSLGQVAEMKEFASEKKGDSSSQTRGTRQSAGGKTAQQIQDQRAQLIASNPREVDMIRDIRKVLHDRLMRLEKEEAVLRSKGLKKINQYNDVVAKVRHINRLTFEMAQAGFKALKALWLRIVHGIV